MAIKKKSQEQATIRGKATTIAAPSQNPALQKLVPAHLRVHRGGRGGAAAAAKTKKITRVVDPAPDAKKKEETNKDGDDDKKYLNFLDDVAALGAFKE